MVNDYSVYFGFRFECVHDLKVTEDDFDKVVDLYMTCRRRSNRFNLGDPYTLSTYFDVCECVKDKIDRWFKLIIKKKSLMLK